MTLVLQSVVNVGELERERVVIRATADVEIGHYAVFCCNAADDGLPLAGNVVHAFWLEDKKIKSGDFVVIYSKRGRDSEKTSENGATSHFYYWELDEPLWNKDTVPILLLISSWKRGSPIK